MKHPDTDFPMTSLLRAAGRALQWRLLLWSLLLLAPTAVLALPLWGVLGGALDYSVHAAALAKQLDALSAFDLIDALGNDGAALKLAGALSVLLTLLLSPFLAGVSLTAARAASPAGFRVLAAGGIAAYARMARMLLWSAVPLGVALALGAAIMKLVARHNQVAITEDEAALASMLGMGAALLLFTLAHATVEAGRAVLAMEPGRSSVVKAWWAGVRLMLRRPVAALVLWLVVGVLALGLAAALAALRIRVPPLGAGAIVLGLLLTQAAAIGLAWMRNARLFGLCALAQADVLLSVRRPD